MIRFLLPVAGIAAFFLLSLATVRLIKPRQPRLYFLAYAAMLLVACTYVYVRVWGLASTEDCLGLAACLFVQSLMCLTMWNSFYSLLWGFSGGLVHDLLNDPSTRQIDRLIRLYDGENSLNRILARRVPNLAAGGYIGVRGDVLCLRAKGRLIAIGTLCSFKLFSLGMGGGIK